jgi:prolyl-tRNA editing enzyme YbaK/EbsC (Cys-tRNA(Pro) deacylase)
MRWTGCGPGSCANSNHCERLRIASTSWEPAAYSFSHVGLPPVVVDDGMGTFTLGSLSSVPAAGRPDLLAVPTLRTLAAMGLLNEVGVVEIDPALSDTATAQQHFGLEPDSLANCVVVGGKREGVERLAACVVLAATRADVNGIVKRFLDVRKASFLPMARAVELTEMEYGGITPIGLPSSWPVLVDRRVVETDVVLIGSGVRRSKIILPGALLGRLAGVEAIDGLGV